jgi:hypothetical protein
MLALLFFLLHLRHWQLTVTEFVLSLAHFTCSLFAPTIKVTVWVKRAQETAFRSHQLQLEVQIVLVSRQEVVPTESLPELEAL